MKIKLFVDNTHALVVRIQDMPHFSKIVNLVDEGDFLGWEYLS